MSKWFVEPEVVRVALSDGEFLDLKKELTVGERNAVSAASSKYVNVEETLTRVIDPQAFYFERAAAYIVGWSAAEEKDGQKKPIPYSRKALAQLPVELYGEILDAVAAHVKKIDETPTPGSAEEKNEKSGESDSRGSSAYAAS